MRNLGHGIVRARARARRGCGAWTDNLDRGARGASGAEREQLAQLFVSHFSLWNFQFTPSLLSNTMNNQDPSLHPPVNGSTLTEGQSIGVTAPVAVEREDNNTANLGSPQNTSRRASLSPTRTAADATPQRPNHSLPEVVKLNVGGREFITSRSTLCRVQPSSRGDMPTAHINWKMGHT